MKLLKRLMAFCLFFAMVLGLFAGIPFATTSAAATGNKVQTDIDGNVVVNLLDGINPDFEEHMGIPGWSFMTGVSQSDEQLFGEGGNWALKLSDSSDTESIWSMSDKNPITSGEKYTFSAQVYGGIGQVSVYFYDASGKDLPDLTVNMATTEAKNEWQTLSHEFIADANATQIAVKVSSTDAGKDAVYFDGIMLTKETKEAFVLDVKNGDFNIDFADGNLPANWGTNMGLANTKKAVTKLDKGNGDYAISIDTTKVASFQLYTDRFAIEPGLPYTATIDIKQTAEMNGQFWIQFYETATSTSAISPKRIDFVGKGTTEDWVTLAVNAIAPTNANYARILFAAPWSGAGITYLDNATFDYATELFNPSFESPSRQTDNTPLGIVKLNKKDVLSGADAHTGKQSLLTEKGPWWESFQLVASPGEMYQATAWVKSADVVTEETNSSILLYFFRANGTEISRKQINVTPSQDAWTEMKIECQAPEETVAVRTMVYMTNGAGKCYFDDLTLTQTTNYNRERNYLENGGFEARKSANKSVVPHLNTGGIIVVDQMNLDYMGEEYGYSPRMFNTTTVHTWTDPVPVTPGETYSATVEATGEGRVQLFIRYYVNETDSQLSYIKDAKGADTGKNGSTGNLEVGTWTELAIAGSVAPEGAKYARVWVCGIWSTDTNALNMNFDNLFFFKGLAAKKIPGELNTLRNTGFEILTPNGSLKDWEAYGVTAHSIADANVTPDEVFEGRYALKVTDPKETPGTKGVQSGAFPIEGGVTYRLSAYVMEDYFGGSGFQMVIRYFNKFGDRISNFLMNTPATGEWNYCEVTGAAPADATYATILLLSGGGQGSCCFDKLVFEPIGNAEYAPVMQDVDWNFLDSGYPRLYFDQERLDEIIRFSKSKSVCAYGYAGTVTLKSLLKSADVFMDETNLELNYQGTIIDYPLYPVLEDASMRKEFETPPGNFTVVYPYLTAFGQQMVRRMETLTLAYALTGNAKYGERAKQYALDLCDWEYWVGYYHTMVVEGGEEHSSQVTGYMVDCVMLAYDLCNDLLTKAEKAKMEEQLIEKGLEAMYHDCWPRMIKDRDMDHATGLVLASCLIMNKDNVDQLKKYLDMGLTYMYWRLNYNLLSGINEGHSYDSLAIDDIIRTVECLERVTGYTGVTEHPYLEELEKTIIGLFEPVNGQMPAYSDSNYSSGYYPYSAAYFSQRGNELATYYLAIGGALSSNYDKLVYSTDMNIAEVVAPDERDCNVTYISSLGYGGLRTGWDISDSLLTVNTNNSQQSHNHMDQNSIQLAFNGSWLLSDTGYKDNAMTSQTYYQMQYTNTTIFVDGKPQVRKGQGTLSQVFNTHLYGYLLGSAPDAYGMEDKQAVLNKFDRHMIMINHDSQPYYVIIDDLDSNKDRNFGWNFYTNGWDRLEIDGVNIEEGKSGTGNHVTIARFGCTLHSHFVGGKVTSKESYYSGYGPTLTVESEKSKNYQFMNVMSAQKGSGSQISYLFEHMMTAQSSTELKNEVEGEINWSSRRTDTTKNTLLSVSIGGPLVMFRAGEVGDWCSFPFEVPATKEYGITIDVGQTMTYSGTWALYLDNEFVAAVEPNGPSGIITIEVGKKTLEAGMHSVKIALSGTPETAFGGTICSVGGITLDTGESMGEGLVKVVEEYNDGDLLGATITYGPVLKDVVLFNRGTNEIIGGGLATNGQQASVIGVNGSEIAEGYAVTKGTSLKYGDLVLMTAEGPVSIAMDYTMAKFPVKNDETEEPVAIHEDFDIENPIYYVSASADAATKVSLNVGVHAPYTVMIGEQVLESTHEGEMLTFTLPEGDHQITILGTHQHVFNQYATNILNIKEWAGCGKANTYYVSCECGANGTETFVDGEVKGHTLKLVKAKDATETQDGNIAHYKCSKCGKLFADKAGTEELTADQVIIPNLAAEIQRRQTIMIVCIVAGVLVLAGGATALIIILKKKKAAGESQVPENEE